MFPVCTTGLLSAKVTPHNLVGREESNLPRIFGAMDTAGLQLVAIAGISYAYLSIPYSRLFGACFGD